MANDLQIPDEFADTLHKLEKLSRNHLLFFRLEVGKLLLEQFLAMMPRRTTATIPPSPRVSMLLPRRVVSI